MTRDNSIEKVLILQGGGSLGAFGCGVFKAIAESQVKVDILAGTSIGGINAAIIAGSKDKRPEYALEQFWLELAENSLDLVPPLMYSLPLDPNTNKVDDYYSHYYQQAGVSFRQALSFYSSALYGNNARLESALFLLLLRRINLRTGRKTTSSPTSRIIYNSIIQLPSQIEYFIKRRSVDNDLIWFFLITKV
jgi:hypothetical protein